MSDFLNNLSEKIGKGVDTLTTKSKMFIETTKLRNDISSLVKQKKQLLFEAGRKGYELSKLGEWSTDELKVFFEEVGKLEKMVEDKNAEIDRIYEEERKQKESSGQSDVVDAQFSAKPAEDSMVYHEDEDEEISFDDEE